MLSFEILVKDRQRLGRCHIVWQIVPGPWTDNGCRTCDLHI